MRGSMARRGLAWRGHGRRVQPKTQNPKYPPSLGEDLEEGAHTTPSPVGAIFHPPSDAVGAGKGPGVTARHRPPEVLTAPNPVCHATLRGRGALPVALPVGVCSVMDTPRRRHPRERMPRRRLGVAGRSRTRHPGAFVGAAPRFPRRPMLFGMGNTGGGGAQRSDCAVKRQEHPESPTRCVRCKLHARTTVGGQAASCPKRGRGRMSPPDPGGGGGCVEMGLFRQRP